MRNGRLNKTELKTLQRAWDIADAYADWKQDNDEEDDAFVYANNVAEAIMWLMGELKGQER